MYLQDKEKFILPLVVKKADPWSLLHFVSWLETKPADTQYCFWNTKGQCLMSQYATECGGDAYYDYQRACNSIGDSCAVIANTSPYTFGAALLRARSFLQAEGGK